MSRNDVYIVACRKPAVLGAKKFPANALESVAGNRRPDFFGNGYTKPGTGMFAGRVHNDKVAPYQALPFLAQLKKLRAFEDPACFGKTLSQGQRFRLSPGNHRPVHSPCPRPNRLGFRPRRAVLVFNRQTLAAFGATAIDHGTPTFGGHSFSKAMGSSTFDSTGLIGSFHRFNLLLC